MNKIVLALLLFGPLAAQAEWLKVVETTTNTVVYVDSQVLERPGAIHRVSELHDHKSPLANDNVSTRFLSDYDCRARLLRRLQVDEFSGHMAQGKVRTTKIGDEERWMSVQPDAAAEAVMKFVCDR